MKLKSKELKLLKAFIKDSLEGNFWPENSAMLVKFRKILKETLIFF